jgi:hypothetical protein
MNEGVLKCCEVVKSEWKCDEWDSDN